MLSSEQTPNNPYDFWEQYRGKIYSSKGGWKAGQDVYAHGYSILNELIGNISYMQMLILNATGRLVEKKLADWFEAHYICLSWPDPRIWCNHIGALCGTAVTDVTAATTAGILAADSRIYGGSQTSIAGMKFIKNALKKFKKGASLEAIISEQPTHNGKPLITGYKRPVNGKDERIAPIERVTEKLGFKIEEHLSLAYQLSDYLLDHFGEGINIGGYAYAFSADQGITGEELYYIRSTIVMSGVTACYIDTYNKTPDSFLPQRCNDIDYQGVSARKIEGYGSNES